MAAMGSHRAFRPGIELARANSARHGAQRDGYAPYADEYARRPGRTSTARTRARRGISPVRPTKKLLILITGVVVAVAGVVAFAASAAARRSASGHVTSATTASHARSGTHATKSLHGITAVSAGIGLRPGAISPSAAGVAAARAVLPALDAYQLAGQRVIYSYKGLTPPANLLWAIRHGRVAGVIFFTDNVGSSAHITAVAKELQQANAAKTNPVRLPLLLMTDQEGGVVRRLNGPPVPSATQIRAVDELPYASAVAAKVKLAMVSWARYPALDEKFPAGLSSAIVQGELRKRLGFAGVTITDALEAGALKNFGGTASRATLAAKAGMDLLLCASENYGQGVTALKALRTDYLGSSATARASFKAAAERILALRATLG